MRRTNIESDTEWKGGGETALLLKKSPRASKRRHVEPSTTCSNLTEPQHPLTYITKLPPLHICAEEVFVNTWFNKKLASKTSLIETLTYLDKLSAKEKIEVTLDFHLEPRLVLASIVSQFNERFRLDDRNIHFVKETMKYRVSPIDVLGGNFPHIGMQSFVFQKKDSEYHLYKMVMAALYHICKNFGIDFIHTNLENYGIEQATSALDELEDDPNLDFLEFCGYGQRLGHYQSLDPSHIEALRVCVELRSRKNESSLWRKTIDDYEAFGKRYSIAKVKRSLTNKKYTSLKDQRIGFLLIDLLDLIKKMPQSLNCIDDWGELEKEDSMTFDPDYIVPLSDRICVRWSQGQDDSIKVGYGVPYYYSDAGVMKVDYVDIVDCMGDDFLQIDYENNPIMSILGEEYDLLEEVESKTIKHKFAKAWRDLAARFY